MESGTFVAQSRVSASVTTNGEKSAGDKFVESEADASLRPEEGGTGRQQVSVMIQVTSEMGATVPEPIAGKEECSDSEGMLTELGVRGSSVSTDDQSDRSPFVLRITPEYEAISDSETGDMAPNITTQGFTSISSDVHAESEVGPALMECSREALPESSVPMVEFDITEHSLPPCKTLHQSDQLATPVISIEPVSDTEEVTGIARSLFQTEMVSDSENLELESISTPPSPLQTSVPQVTSSTAVIENVSDSEDMTVSKPWQQEEVENVSEDEGDPQVSASQNGTSTVQLQMSGNSAFRKVSELEGLGGHLGGVKRETHLLSPTHHSPVEIEAISDEEEQINVSSTVTSVSLIAPEVTDMGGEHVATNSEPLLAVSNQPSWSSGPMLDLQIMKVESLSASDDACLLSPPSVVATSPSWGGVQPKSEVEDLELVEKDVGQTQVGEEANKTSDVTPWPFSIVRMEHSYSYPPELLALLAEPPEVSAEEGEEKDVDSPASVSLGEHTTSRSSTPSDISSSSSIPPMADPTKLTSLPISETLLTSEDLTNILQNLPSSTGRRRKSKSEKLISPKPLTGKKSKMSKKHGRPKCLQLQALKASDSFKAISSVSSPASTGIASTLNKALHSALSPPLVSLISPDNLPRIMNFIQETVPSSSLQMQPNTVSHQSSSLERVVLQNLTQSVAGRLGSITVSNVVTGTSPQMSANFASAAEVSPIVSEIVNQTVQSLTVGDILAVSALDSSLHSGHVPTRVANPFPSQLPSGSETASPVLQLHVQQPPVSMPPVPQLCMLQPSVSEITAPILPLPLPSVSAFPVSHQPIVSTVPLLPQTSVSSAPVSQSHAQQTSVSSAPVSQSHAQQMSTSSAPVSQSHAQQTHVSSAPVSQSHAQQTSVSSAPVSQSHAQQTSVSSAPVSQSHTQQMSTSSAPVSQSHTQQMSVSSAPVLQSKTQGPSSLSSLAAANLPSAALQSLAKQPLSKPHPVTTSSDPQEPVSKLPPSTKPSTNSTTSISTVSKNSSLIQQLLTTPSVKPLETVVTPPLDATVQSVAQSVTLSVTATTTVANTEPADVDAQFSATVSSTKPISTASSQLDVSSGEPLDSPTPSPTTPPPQYSISLPVNFATSFTATSNSFPLFALPRIVPDFPLEITPLAVNPSALKFLVERTRKPPQASISSTAASTSITHTTEAKVDPSSSVGAGPLAKMSTAAVSTVSLPTGYGSNSRQTTAIPGQLSPQPVAAVVLAQALPKQPSPPMQMGSTSLAQLLPKILPAAQKILSAKIAQLSSSSSSKLNTAPSTKPSLPPPPLPPPVSMQQTRNTEIKPLAQQTSSAVIAGKTVAQPQATTSTQLKLSPVNVQTLVLASALTKVVSKSASVSSVSPLTPNVVPGSLTIRQPTSSLSGIKAGPPLPGARGGATPMLRVPPDSKLKGQILNLQKGLAQIKGQLAAKSAQATQPVQMAVTMTTPSAQSRATVQSASQTVTTVADSAVTKRPILSTTASSSSDSAQVRRTPASLAPTQQELTSSTQTLLSTSMAAVTQSKLPTSQAPPPTVPGKKSAKVLVTSIKPLKSDPLPSSLQPTVKPSKSDPLPSSLQPTVKPSKSDPLKPTVNPSKSDPLPSSLQPATSESLELVQQSSLREALKIFGIDKSPEQLKDLCRSICTLTPAVVNVRQLLDDIQPSSYSVLGGTLSSHLPTFTVPESTVESLERQRGVSTLSQDREIPSKEEPYKPYSSPLLMFQSYRLSPYFRTQAKLPLSSLTHSNKINPQKIMCKFELLGVCNDPKCPYQHFRDVNLSREELVQDIISYQPTLAGCTESELSVVDESLPELQDAISGKVSGYARSFMQSYGGKITDEELYALTTHKVNQERIKLNPKSARKNFVSVEERYWVQERSGTSRSVQHRQAREGPLLVGMDKEGEGEDVVPLGEHRQPRVRYASPGVSHFPVHCCLVYQARPSLTPPKK